MSKFLKTPDKVNTYQITKEGLEIPWTPLYPESISTYFIECAVPCERDPKYIQTLEDFYDDYDFFCTVLRDYEPVSMESFLEYVDKFFFTREYSTEKGREIIYANLNPNPLVIDEDEEYDDEDWDDEDFDS